MSFDFTQDQLDDFGWIDELIDEIDLTGDQDVLLLAWQNAWDLVSCGAIWTAIERFVSISEEVDFDRIDVLTSLNVCRPVL